MAFRMKYKRQIQELQIYYFDKKTLAEDMLDTYGDRLREVSKNVYQSDFDMCNQVFPVIDLICDLTLRKPFRNKNLYKPLNKDQQLEALDIIISDKTRILKSVKDLYKGKAKDTEKRIKLQIKALNWCKDSILNNHIELFKCESGVSNE